jgi:hypothetical protein
MTLEPSRPVRRHMKRKQLLQAGAWRYNLVDVTRNLLAYVLTNHLLILIIQNTTSDTRSDHHSG